MVDNRKNTPPLIHLQTIRQIINILKIAIKNCIKVHEVEGIINFVTGPVRIHTCNCANDICDCDPLNEENINFNDVVHCLQSIISDPASPVKVRKDQKKIAKVHKFGNQPYLVVRSTDDPTIHLYRVRVLGQPNDLEAETNNWTEDEGEPFEVQHQQGGPRYLIHTYHQKRDNKEEEYRCAVQVVQVEHEHAELEEVLY